MVILILFVMFCAPITSWYDFTHDVLCTHRIVVWFHWWCLVHTSHRRMILLMMFCAHITSSYDSTDYVLYVHRTGFMIPQMMFCAHITSHYDSTDDVLCSNPTGLMIQQLITTRTVHRGYDSRNEFICTLDMRVMIPQMIPCVHVALQIWFSDHFMNPNNSIVMICYYSNTTIASSHESPYMIQ